MQQPATLDRLLPGLGLARRIARIGPTEADKYFFKTVRQLAALSDGDLGDPYEKHAWAHACMHVRALALASVPFRIYTGSVDNPEPADEAEGRAIQDVFDAPNPLMSAAQMWEALSLYLDGQGGTYFFFESGTGKARRVTDMPQELFVIGQDQIDVVKGKDGYPFGYVYSGGSGAKVPLDPEQVAAVLFFNPKNPLVGLSPISAIKDAISTDARAARYSKAVFDNYGDVGGVVSTDQVIDDGKYKELRRWWDDTHAGAHNAKRAAILDSGLKYTPTTLAHRDMEFLEQRRWSREEIIAVFGLHKLDLGLLESVNYATALVASRMVWEKTHLPRMALIQDALWLRLFRHLHGGKYWGAFDLSGVEAFQAGLAERVLAGAGLAGMGFPINDVNVRLNLGMPEVEGGDVGRLPFGLQPIGSSGDADAYKAKASAQAWRRTAIGRLTNGADGSLLLIPNAVRSKHPTRKAVVTVPAMPTTRTAEAPVDPGWDHWVRAILDPGEALMMRLLKREFRKIRDEIKAAVAEAFRFAPRVRAPKKATEILPGSKEWKDRIWKVLRPAYEQQVIEAMEDAAESLGVAFAQNAYDPLIPSFMDVRENMIGGATDTVWTKLKDTIQEGLGVNETVAQVQSRVIEEMSGYLEGGAPRALTIARTETAAASNWARNEVYKHEGVKRHQWLTAMDEHVRASHQALQGKSVKIGDDFVSGDGNKLKYPNDPEAPAGDSINCRCRVAPVFEEEE